jgi:hypothetical protein
MERRFHFNGLCVDLLDRFFVEQLGEDRCMLVRTAGCITCGDTCLVKSAIRCNVCEHVFWCCEQCRKSDSHTDCPGRPVSRKFQLGA